MNMLKYILNIKNGGLKDENTAGFHDIPNMKISV